MMRTKYVDIKFITRDTFVYEQVGHCQVNTYICSVLKFRI
jgi:hypothetical protein